MMNASGAILHKQAAASVEELRLTMAAVGQTIERLESEKEQQQQQSQPLSSTSGAAPATSFSANATTTSTGSKALTQQQAAVQHHTQRFNVVELRKALVSSLRSKVLDPLVSSTAATNLRRAQSAPQNALLFVHHEAMQLAAKDADLKSDLEAESPQPMQDSAAADASTTTTAARSRGSLSLRSLAPVAWCIRAAYAEAARAEITKHRRNGGGSAAGSSTSINSTPLAADGGSRRSVASTSGGGSASGSTVMSLLRRLPCYQQLVDIAPLPRSVKDYLCDDLDDLVL
jgi:hypothetical protein